MGKKSSHQQNYTFVCSLFGRDIPLTRITPKRRSDLFHFHSFTKYPCGLFLARNFVQAANAQDSTDANHWALIHTAISQGFKCSKAWPQEFSLKLSTLYLIHVSHEKNPLTFHVSNSRSFTDTENLSRFVPEASLPIGKPAAVDKTTPSTPRGSVVNAGISEASKNVVWFHTNWIVWLNYSIYILGEL